MSVRNLTAVASFVLVFASLAVAQSSLETKWHCAKPVDQQYEIGDTPGHSYGVAQGNCNVVSGKTGEKTGVFTEIQEMWNGSFQTHGRMIVTMADGEKIYYTYKATGSLAKKTAAEKWKMTGGTGKHKSNKGSGTCSGTFNDDGTSDWVCSGKFSTGA
ncbi:MAG: hypothetical protein ROO76_09550 [Terriglobia bacterium]|nr:hypothetical protein [Terriglobia bacterium]